MSDTGVRPARPEEMMEVRRKAREWDAWVKGQTTFEPRPQTDLEKAEAWDRLNGRFGGWRT